MSDLLITMDLDGTLEDSRADMVASVQRLRTRLGLSERADGEFWGKVIRGMPHLYRTCFAEHLGREPSDEALAGIRDAYAADYGTHICAQTKLYDGIAEALPRLAELAPLALVTNKPEALSELLLKALGVREHFSAIIGGDTCHSGKPDPVTLETAAERCGFVGAPGRVFHVGDSGGDIRCAKAFGATSIWCAWGYLDAAPDAPAPDLQVALPGELVALIQKQS
jgi:phosphoglycolate phosphatase